MSPLFIKGKTYSQLTGEANSDSKIVSLDGALHVYWLKLYVSKQSELTVLFELLQLKHKYFLPTVKVK